MPYTLFCFTLQGIHLCNRTKIVALLPEIGDHIGQGLDGLTLSLIHICNMHESSYSLNRQFGSEQWCLYTGKHLLSFVDNHGTPGIPNNRP